MKYLATLIFAAVLSLGFSAKAYALDPFNQDVPTDPCGSIDPDRPCYQTGATSCQKGVGYDACKKYCDCTYNANLKKCGTKVTCKDLALTERNACYGNCIADW